MWHENCIENCSQCNQWKYVSLIGQLIKTRWMIFKNIQFMSKHKFNRINPSTYTCFNLTCYILAHILNRYDKISIPITIRFTICKILGMGYYPPTCCFGQVVSHYKNVFIYAFYVSDWMVLSLYLALFVLFTIHCDICSYRPKHQNGYYMKQI